MDDKDRLAQVLQRFLEEPAIRGELETQYQVGVVTFADILGFKDLIEQGSASRLRRILEMFYSEGRDERFPREGFVSHCFSDAVVRVLIPRESDFFPDETSSDRLARAVRSELVALAYVQHALIVFEGVFIRGGITIGSIYCDERSVFGPALTEAYRIESTIAKYPRIVIGSAILEELARNFARLSYRDPTLGGDGNKDSQWHHLNYFISRDRSRRVHYLDYFPFCSKYGDTYHVLKHRERIVRAYEAAKTRRVKAKYHWLAAYHNWSLNSYEFGDIGITDANAENYRIANLMHTSAEAYAVAEGPYLHRLEIARIFG